MTILFLKFKSTITILTTSLFCFVFTEVMAALQSIVFSTVGTSNDSGEMCDIRDARRGFLESQKYAENTVTNYIWYTMNLEKSCIHILVLCNSKQGIKDQTNT